MPSWQPWLPLLQPHTLAAEDVGKLADFVQQLPVGDLGRVPGFIAFPEKPDKSCH